MEEIGKTPLTGRSSTSTSRWCNGLIRILDAENVSIIGEKGSYIDGSNTFDAQGEEHYRGPHGISAWRCKNLHFEGYTFLHSANWCHAIFQSQNITVRKLSIYGGHDGVDIRTCDNVLIEDCLMHTGDDCVAGFDNHDVIVRNCDFQTACQIFRLGGNNILIENCKSTAPGAFGFRKNLSEEDRQACRWTDENCRHIALPVFSYYCDFRAVIRKTPGNIVIRNCSFDNVRELIRLQFDGEHKWCCNRSLHDITFEDCEFLNLEKPGTLHGDKDEKVNFTLRRCRITANPEFSDSAILKCANFENNTLEDVKFENYDKPTFQMITEGPVNLVRTEGLTLEKAE
jgi:polygalacturonase